MKNKVVFCSVFSAFLIFASFLSGARLVNAHGGGSSSDGKWGNWFDTSSCAANQCGTTHGTKTQSRTCVFHSGSNECKPETTVCDKGCPTVTWSTYRYVCDSGYKYSGGGWCYKSPNKWREATKEDFGPITFTYDKSSDPNKCHRPTGSSLGVPSWAMDDFNSDNHEWKDKVDINCHNERPQEDSRVVNCNNAPFVACPTATPTPTQKPTCSPSVSPSPTASESPSGEPTATPSPSPEESSEPSPTLPTGGTGGSSDSGGGGGGGAPSCNDSKPNAPYLTSVSLIGANTVRVTWQKVSGISHYSIYYGPTSGNYIYSVPDTADVDTYLVNGLSSGFFIVKAVNRCNSSDASNELSVGKVLGASTGQVLGASTMAETGSFSEDVVSMLFTLGSLLISFAVRKNFAKKIQ